MIGSCHIKILSSPGKISQGTFRIETREDCCNVCIRGRKSIYVWQLKSNTNNELFVHKDTVVWKKNVLNGRFEELRTVVILLVQRQVLILNHRRESVQKLVKRSRLLLVLPGINVSQYLHNFPRFYFLFIVPSDTMYLFCSLTACLLMIHCDQSRLISMTKDATESPVEGGINISFITSNKVQVLLLLNQYLYRCNKKTMKKKYWVCVHSGCEVSIHTDVMNVYVCGGIAEHCHQPNPEMFDVRNARQRMKERSNPSVNSTSQAIFPTSLEMSTCLQLL